MDICSFVNSNAIAEHLRNINYCFTSKEAAWLIYQCKKITLQEKHEAWKWLIANMPDCELEERLNCLHWDSLHDVIRMYMSIENKYLELFRRKETNVVYQYRYFCSKDTDWVDEFNVINSTVDECWKDVLGGEEDEGDIEIIQIKKTYIDSNQHIDVFFDSKRNVLEIDTSLYTDEERDVIVESFDGFWFAFPVPFKVGDMLIMKNQRYPREYIGEDGVFILEGITPWEVDRIAKRIENGSGDTTDMCAWGYFQDEDGRVFQETIWNYMDLDYYEGPFDGIKRLLVAISNFLKGEICLSIVLSAYRKVILDKFTKDVMLGSWFTEEGLELAGLHDVVVENNKRKTVAGLNYKTTFNHYGNWENNNEAVSVCRKIASNYTQPKETLFLYGPNGCGKTTLLQCLGNMATDLSKPKLLYITAEDFFIKYTEIVSKGSEPRDWYKQYNFVIIDDLQFIADKEASQKEMLRIIDYMITMGYQVVLAADRTIEELGIDERFKKKLNTAKIVAMQ